MKFVSFFFGRRAKKDFLFLCLALIERIFAINYVEIISPLDLFICIA